VTPDQAFITRCYTTTHHTHRCHTRTATPTHTTFATTTYCLYSPAKKQAPPHGWRRRNHECCRSPRYQAIRRSTIIVLWIVVMVDRQIIAENRAIGGRRVDLDPHACLHTHTHTYTTTAFCHTPPASLYRPPLPTATYLPSCPHLLTCHTRTHHLIRTCTDTTTPVDERVFAWRTRAHARTTLGVKALHLHPAHLERYIRKKKKKKKKKKKTDGRMVVVLGDLRRTPHATPALCHLHHTHHHTTTIPTYRGPCYYLLPRARRRGRCQTLIVVVTFAFHTRTTPTARCHAFTPTPLPRYPTLDGYTHAHTACRTLPRATLHTRCAPFVRSRGRGRTCAASLLRRVTPRPPFAPLFLFPFTFYRIQLSKTPSPVPRRLCANILSFHLVFCRYIALAGTHTHPHHTHSTGYR